MIYGYNCLTSILLSKSVVCACFIFSEWYYFICNIFRSKRWILSHTIGVFWPIANSVTLKFRHRKIYRNSMIRLQPFSTALLTIMITTPQKQQQPNEREKKRFNITNSGNFVRCRQIALKMRSSAGNFIQYTTINNQHFQWWKSMIFFIVPPLFGLLL